MMCISALEGQSAPAGEALPISQGNGHARDYRLPQKCLSGHETVQMVAEYVGDSPARYVQPEGSSPRIACPMLGPKYHTYRHT